MPRTPSCWPLLLPALLLLTAACARNRFLPPTDRLVPRAGDSLEVRHASASAASIGRVSVRARSGTVHVVAGRDDSVRATLVVANARSRAGLRARPCDRVRAASSRVLVQPTDGGVDVTSSPNLGDDCHEYWRVEVPAHVWLDARADVSRMQVDGVAGGVRLSVGVGAVVATLPRGAVDVEIRDVGDVEVRTATDDYGDATAESQVGHARIDVDGHRVDAAHTPGAGERVALRGNGRDRLRVRTGVGDVRLHVDRRPRGT